MGDVNKTIEISYVANIGALEKALKRIPNITEKQMSKAIKEVEKDLKKFEKTSLKASKKFEKRFAGMKKQAKGAGLAIAGAGTAVFMFAQKIADATNDLVDTSTKTGIATDTLQGLRIAAEGSGLAFEQFIGPLQRLQLHMTEANKGNKTSTELFQDMGIQVKDTNGNLKDADSLFREMMGSLGDMSSDLERNSLLMRTFGKQGAMFAQSGVVGALDDFVHLGREFGVDVGPKAVKQAGDFQRAIADIKTVSTGALQDLMIAFTGANGITQAIDQATFSIISFKELAIASLNILSVPFDSLLHQIQAVNLALQGDFDGAGSEITKSYENAFDAVNSVANILTNVESQISALKKARNAIRSDQEKAISTSGKTDTTKKQEEEKKNLKEITELKENDLDVIGSLFDAQIKLQSLNDKLYENQLSDEQKVSLAHQKRLLEIEEITFAETESIKIRGDELKKGLNEGLISENLYMQRRMEMVAEMQNLFQSANDSRMHSENQLHKDLKNLDQIALEEQLALFDDKLNVIKNYTFEFATAAHDVLQTYADIQNNLFSEFEEKEDERLKNRLTAIENAEKNGVLSAEQAQKKKEEIEKNHTKALEKEYLRVFKIQQQTAIAGIIIDGAQAVAKVFAQWGFPAGVPIAALVASKTALELATVKNQAPPKFDVGGMVGQSDPLAPDQMQAQLLTGEAVLDRSTVERLGGEQGVQQLGNSSQNGVIVIQPFKHFDRYVSSAQRRGRFGIKKIASGNY